MPSTAQMLSFLGHQCKEMGHDGSNNARTSLPGLSDPAGPGGSGNLKLKAENSKASHWPMRTLPKDRACINSFLTTVPGWVCQLLTHTLADCIWTAGPRLLEPELNQPRLNPSTCKFTLMFSFLIKLGVMTMVTA
ncbi:hypothetical protein CEXT_48721 [Caerostris extrusa]|uniref:Uncharacterized protein n=1 Tax=Caerostris extrusa TaxID=172846 RepID=A0AAV4S6F1_CAEEX|nr:hypothetical protein CEXT_48721 [Caerostris extrusa]